MIQPILFFTLGFLCAGFLALMIGPAVWRRAVNLTRRRIEASVPLTLNEIHADKDKMRAEFAMSTRRLEMSIKSFRDKASAQIIEINRNRDELKALAAERDEKNRALTELEAKAGELRTELRQREDQLQRLGERLAEADKNLEGKALEIDRLSRMYEEATFVSSTRQIELVARESDVERLTGDLSRLKGERKGDDRRVHDLAAENKQMREALKSEKKRFSELEAKNDRMIATISDREEALDRREKEMARLRDQLKAGTSTESTLNMQLVEAQGDRVRLESEIAELTLQLSTLLSGAKGADIEKAIEKLTEDRDRLESRLAILTRENRKLKADIAAFERSKTEDWSSERRASALLREQMNDLAAEVVNLTAMLEGPGSPIHTLIAKQPARQAGAPDQTLSLADRIRSLQKAASAV